MESCLLLLAAPLEVSIACEADNANTSEDTVPHLQVAEAASETDGDQKKFSNYSYPAMTKTQGSFRLNVEAGEFTDSEILVMLGENGTGEGIICFLSVASSETKLVQPEWLRTRMCAGTGLDCGRMMGQAHSAL